MDGICRSLFIDGIMGLFAIHRGLVGYDGWCRGKSGSIFLGGFCEDSEAFFLFFLFI